MHQKRHGFSWFVYCPERNITEDGSETEIDYSRVFVRMQFAGAKWDGSEWIDTPVSDANVTGWIMVTPDMIPAKAREALDAWIDAHDSREVAE